ncbi:NADH dehydrogenase [ubiquinone] 1 beta subcomplex subunit 9 [Magallana gigas]|uniref:NADH dehydrogenase [ubiquinone] 1 beta subcomplex subunit 9 n=1 Tax=Magallana gigas TaxID=29159 RepID=UPI00333E98CB
MTTFGNLATVKIPRHLQFTYLSHAQRVLRYYKKHCRHIEWCAFTRVPARLGRVELRRLIDSHKDEKDFVKATELLERGEQQVLSYWFFNNNHNFSPGGTCYDRYQYFPDYTIDYWHPLEKAQYPKYFATREIRKMEHILWWHEKYGADPEQKTIEEMMDDVAEQRKVAKEAEERKAIDK